MGANDERAARVEAVFAAALPLDPAEREHYLEEACAGDAPLHAEVSALLEHHDADADFLGTPAVVELAAVETPPAVTPAGPALIPGHRLGSYRIIDVIGEGGMGVVYRAEQDEPRRIVALKVIRAGAASRSTLSRFRYEAELLGRLDHPGIAQIYEAGTADAGSGEQPFIAMQLIDGRPLLDHARVHDTGVTDRVELLARIAEAVHHAHQKGVIHRDLKPGNILVDDEGRPRVLDFGVARATDPDARTTTLRTNVGQLVGTIAYMSPEQAAGDPTLVDTRSDVYALGVVGYELLSGRLPYDLADRPVHEAVRIVRETPARPLGRNDRHLRGDLETIVARALEKDKDRRYPSASDFAADLRRSLRSEPIIARPASAIYQLRTFARRHTGLVASVAAIFLLLATGVAVTAALAVRLADQRDDAERLQGEAETAAHTARHINEVLLEMFAAADPQVEGRDVKVIDVLAAGAARVEAELRDQPEVYAAVRDTLGMSYYNLGLYDEADGHLTAAVATRRETLGAEAPDTLLSEGHLALLRKWQGRLDEAERLYRHALAGQERLLGDDDPETLTTRNNLAETLKALGRFAEAAPLYERVLAVQRRDFGDEHPHTLGTINNRAGLLIDLDRADEAEPLYRELVGSAQRVFGESHPLTLTALNNLAYVVQTLGRPEEAEPLRRQVMDVSREVLSDGHPRTIASVLGYASLLVELERLDEAELYYEEAVDLAALHLPAEHWMIGTARGGLGALLVRRMRTAEAEPHLLRSHELLTGTFGPAHPRTREAVARLVTLYEAWERADEAARYREMLDASE